MPFRSPVFIADTDAVSWSHGLTSFHKNIQQIRFSFQNFVKNLKKVFQRILICDIEIVNSNIEVIEELGKNLYQSDDFEEI